MATLLSLAQAGVAADQQPKNKTSASEIGALEKYRMELTAFRNDCGGSHELPDIPFFQFGMGLRTKYLFRNGKLLNALTGVLLHEWDATNTLIVPPDYSVIMATRSGGRVRIFEDEKAVWLEEHGSVNPVQGTGRKVRLPAFTGQPYGSILRVLHHEILINILDGKPVPNFYVYQKPWYRDGAMMALCLKATGNLELLRDWILSLRQPFDRNNGGETEADNLGEALFLVSCVADKSHPLVDRVMKEVPRFEIRDAQGLYIKGRSDFSEHPVYQTKWLKYGLHALSLPDPYAVPVIPDAYSALFWIDYREGYVPGHDAADRDLYPYLGWATDHFHRLKRSPISNRDYPLTWESRASQAQYAGMKIIDPVFEQQKTATPHTWHAAEVFLYLLDHFKDDVRFQSLPKEHD